MNKNGVVKKTLRLAQDMASVAHNGELLGRSLNELDKNEDYSIRLIYKEDSIKSLGQIGITLTSQELRQLGYRKVPATIGIEVRVYPKGLA